MRLNMNWKQAVAAGVMLAGLGATAALAANHFTKPKSVVHVVTLYYKDGTTDEQKAAVLAGIEKMAAEVPGIKSVWLKTSKVQGTFLEKMPDGTSKAHQFTDAFAIEFEDKAAFEKYADHPAHKAFEDLYVPVRGHSATHDLTN
jgi:hypothetical protein